MDGKRLCVVSLEEEEEQHADPDEDQGEESERP